MVGRLEGAVCVVTGTASGMGKAAAILFAAEVAISLQVLVTFSNREVLSRALTEIRLGTSLSLYL